MISEEEEQVPEETPRVETPQDRRNEVATGLDSYGDAFMVLAILLFIGAVIGAVVPDVNVKIILIAAGISSALVMLAIKAVFHGLAEMLRCLARMEDRQAATQPRHLE